MAKIMTIKQTSQDEPENELGFIGRVIKERLEVFKSSWDMTLPAVTILTMAAGGHPGKAIYILDKIDPQQNSLVTVDDIVSHFPFGFKENWKVVGTRFEMGSDNHKVFKR